MAAVGLVCGVALGWLPAGRQESFQVAVVPGVQDFAGAPPFCMAGFLRLLLWLFLLLSCHIVHGQHRLFLSMITLLMLNAWAADGQQPASWSVVASQGAIQALCMEECDSQRWGDVSALAAACSAFSEADQCHSAGRNHTVCAAIAMLV